MALLRGITYQPGVPKSEDIQTPFSQLTRKDEGFLSLADIQEVEKEQSLFNVQDSALIDAKKL